MKTWDPSQLPTSDNDSNLLVPSVETFKGLEGYFAMNEESEQSPYISRNSTWVRPATPAYNRTLRRMRCPSNDWVRQSIYIFRDPNYYGRRRWSATNQLMFLPFLSPETLTPTPICVKTELSCLRLEACRNVVSYLTDDNFHSF